MRSTYFIVVLRCLRPYVMICHFVRMYLYRVANYAILETMKWYLQAWKKYAVFRGRSRRREFWTFFLTNLITIHLLIFLIIATAIAAPETAGAARDGFYILFVASILFLAVYLLAILLPTLALYVRRLHDIGRSGRWFWLNLAPFGNLVLLIMCAQDSELGDNEYGINPKGVYQPIIGYNPPAPYASVPADNYYEQAQQGAPASYQSGRAGQTGRVEQGYRHSPQTNPHQHSQTDLGRHSRRNTAAPHYPSTRTNPLLRPENISDAPTEDFGNDTYRTNDYKGGTDTSEDGWSKEFNSQKKL